MHRTPLIGATMALALLIPGAPAVRAHHSTADVVFEWNQILQDTVPVPQNPLTPRFFAMTHIAMFDADQRHRARIRAVSRPACATSAMRRPTPRPPRPPTTSWSPSTRRRLRSMLPRWRGSSAIDPSTLAQRGAEIGAQVAEGNPGVAPERRMGSLAIPTLCRAAGARALAADTARQRRPVLHAPAECRAAGPGQPDPVPAAASADAAEPALRHRSERGHPDRPIEQRDAHARADGDRPAVGRHRRQRHRHRDQLHVGLERHRPRRGARAPAVAGRNRAGVRARERLGARRAADLADQQVRVRSVASGDRDSAGRSRSAERHRT